MTLFVALRQGFTCEAEGLTRQQEADTYERAACGAG